MKNIKTRQFRVLADCVKVYEFMLEIYEKDWRNGVPGPFFEYDYSSFSYWMDISYSYKNRIWEDGDKIVAFCFYTNPVTDIYFSLRPGYGELAPEMIAYAEECMPQKDEKIQLVLFAGQDALMRAAAQKGYETVWEQIQYGFDDISDYPLPEGFHFVEPRELDLAKVAECCWRGFDHEEEEGPWNGRYIQNNYLLQTAPHATMELSVAVVDENGDYACWAGMWWTPENKLAYLEPLCTIPKYRNRGLASAALSKLYRTMQNLGATHMTGGQDEFYHGAGAVPALKWTFWKK